VIETTSEASLLLALQMVQPPMHALKFQGTQESTSPNWGQKRWGQRSHQIRCRHL